MRPRVMIESPFAGDTKRNIEYARRALRDSIERGEAPFAIHLLYPQALDDNITQERALGLACGLRWLSCAEKVIFYLDYGSSIGMDQAKREANFLGIPTEMRKIGPNP